MNTRAHLLMLPPIALIALLATTAVADDDVVHRSHRFDGAQVRHLRIDHRAGTILLERAEGHTIEVELAIKPGSDERGARTPDLEDMDLTARTRRDELTLAFRERKVRADWVIRIPALMELTIEQGFGTVEGVLPGGTAFVDLGAGSVHLEVERSAAGRIELQAGVGDTHLMGAEGEERRRLLVGSRSSGRGEGAHMVRAAVRVGEVELRLN